MVLTNKEQIDNLPKHQQEQANSLLYAICLGEVMCDLHLIDHAKAKLKELGVEYKESHD